MAPDIPGKPALFLAKLTKPIGRLWHHTARVKVYESREGWGWGQKSNLVSSGCGWRKEGRRGGEYVRERCVKNLIKIERGERGGGGGRNRRERKLVFKEREREIREREVERDIERERSGERERTRGNEKKEGD